MRRLLGTLAKRANKKAPEGAYEGMLLGEPIKKRVSTAHPKSRHSHHSCR